jgi:hypothetical protein
MTLLACDGDLIALRLAEDGYWNLDALLEHMRECRRCGSFYSAMAAAMGSQGGMAGRGAVKRRGSSEYYRALASRRGNLPQ